MNNHNIVIKTSCSLINIKCQEITHVEASGNYSLIYTLPEEKPLFISKSLKQIENILPNYLFCRCHYSYLINLSQVHIVDLIKKVIKLSNNRTVPISRRKYTDFKKTLMEFNINE